MDVPRRVFHEHRKEMNSRSEWNKRKAKDKESE
jgi:hypothetical protein